MHKGFFITIEGIDGSGKTTQVKLLSEYMRQQGIKVLVTREPGGTAIGEQIRGVLLDGRNHRMDPVTEALLYAAARAQLVAEVIKPALAQGYIVLCDRFVDSSLAYQGYARGLGMDFIEGINNTALRDLWPDITFLLDIPPQMALRRQSLRKGQQSDRLETEGLSFLQKVYEGYHRLASIYPERIRVIDATASEHEVLSRLIEAIFFEDR